MLREAVTNTGQSACGIFPGQGLGNKCFDLSLLLLSYLLPAFFHQPNPSVRRQRIPQMWSIQVSLLEQRIKQTRTSVDPEGQMEGIHRQKQTTQYFLSKIRLDYRYIFKTYRIKVFPWDRNRCKIPITAGLVGQGPSNKHISTSSARHNVAE